jgi:peptide/nickel transport system ATP-binding protein
MASTTRNVTDDSAAERPLFEVADLAVSFDNPFGPRVQAVDGASMSIYPRQTLAVVGESGCGKSVTAMSAMQLIPRPPGRFDRGSILLEGRDLLSMSEKDMLKVRGREIAMIFQEPMTSLNPVYTVGDQIIEAILLHQKVSEREAIDVAVAALDDVGMPDPASRLHAYPHQFSGGMRQRVMIAMALACRPKLLLADEPTTALDVTIQAQILDLLKSLQASRDMGIMLITHDLGVVAENADVVCVMYAGRVVEYARVFDLFDRPLHPYTRGLLNSIPKLHDTLDRLTTIEQVIRNAAEFHMLADRGVVPWWPTMAPPDSVGPRDSAADSVLVEVEPEHWVGVWRTTEAESKVRRRPDIAFRRERQPVAVG